MGFRGKIGLIVVAAVLAGFATIRVVDWWTAWPARVVLRGPEWQYPFAFSPDGAVLSTRSKEPGGILLWDARDGRKLAAWPAPDKRLQFAGAFSPDGRTFALPWFLASTGKNFSVDLIDAASGRVRATFQSPMPGFLGLRFLDGGKTLRLVATDATGKVVAVSDVEVATGRILATRTLSFPTPPGFVVVVSNDGRFLATATPGGAMGPSTVAIWDLGEDREALRLPPIVGLGITRAMAFSPDGRTLAVGRDDGSIQLWDLSSRSLRSTLRGHRRDFSPLVLSFSPDGSTLASMGHLSRRGISLDTARMFWVHFFGESDRSMQTELILLDVKTGRRLVGSRWDELAVFAPDGRSVATGHDDGAVRIHPVPGHAEAR